MSFILQCVCFLWVVSMGIFNFSVMMRCMIHDRSYRVSETDWMTGACVLYLTLYGLPSIN